MTIQLQAPWFVFPTGQEKARKVYLASIFKEISSFGGIPPEEIEQLNSEINEQAASKMVDDHDTASSVLLPNTTVPSELEINDLCTVTPEMSLMSHFGPKVSFGAYVRRIFLRNTDPQVH